MKNLQKKNGVTIFSDDGKSLIEDTLADEAFKIVAELGGAIFQHCEKSCFSNPGDIAPPSSSSELILIPDSEEFEILKRDLDLVEKYNTRYHAQHLSSKKSVELIEQAKNYEGLEGKDLASAVTCGDIYSWGEGTWKFGNESTSEAFQTMSPKTFHIVAIDYGVKKNILRNLVKNDCRVTFVPATTPAETILALNPDGVFLSNGPGDPAATGRYAVPIIKTLIDSDTPIFGICLGHQLLGLALGAKTEKMKVGHRGANHPVKDLLTGKIEITSQNHGFVLSEKSLPENVEITHRSLFDNSIEGLKYKDKAIFSVQYHPEASPGPTESDYLFKKFITLVQEGITSHHA